MTAAPANAPPAVLVPMSNGAAALRSFQPTISQVADRIRDALTLATPLAEALPFPSGMSLRMCDSDSQAHLLLETKAFTR